MIDLQNKTVSEKAKIKSQELAKCKIDKFIKDDLEVEIVGDITNVDNHIEFYAKAFKNGKQLGFGKDGTTELEHFIIHNPPVLVDDPNGEIVREWTDEITKETKQRKLTYNPEEALKNSLAHTIGLVAKDGKDIIKGKVGNTTSTFYPAAGANSPVDGWVYFTDSTWSGCRNASVGSLARPSDHQMPICAGESDSSAAYYIKRGIFLFNTASIPDDDEISSGTISLYWDGSTNQDNDGYDYINIVSSNPINDNNLVNGDYSRLGLTAFSSNLDLTGQGVGYKNFSLNSDGKTNITKTGISKFGAREGHDLENHTIAANSRNEMVSCAADETGTDQDPKLVVVHSAATTDYDMPVTVGAFILTGVAVGLKRGWALTAGVGSFILTGIATTLKRTWKMAVSVGSFVLTGIATTFQVAKKMVASVGAFTLTGIAAVLRKGKTLVVDVGTFTLTGIDTLFHKTLSMIASAGSFTLTGIAINLKRGWKMGADLGTFALAWLDVIITYAITMSVAVGTFTLTGVTVTLTKGYNLITGTGSFVLSMKDILIKGWFHIAKHTASWTEIDKS